jgi:hypothetical protein
MTHFIPDTLLIGRKKEKAILLIKTEGNFKMTKEWLNHLKYKKTTANRHFD